MSERPHGAIVRRARATEFSQVESLILSACAGALAGTMTPAGRENFQDFVRGNALKRRWRSGSNFWVAAEGSRLVGALEASALGHIYLFFVAPDRQGRGIGRALFERVAWELDTNLSANAAPNALPIYLRLGFELTGSAFTRQGITAYPVKYFRERSRPEARSAKA